MRVCVCDLEDSGLILSAEGPLGFLFGVHNPGNTGMRLGVLVHFRWLQLENIGGEGERQVVRICSCEEARVETGLRKRSEST